MDIAAAASPPGKGHLPALVNAAGFSTEDGGSFHPHGLYQDHGTRHRGYDHGSDGGPNENVNIEKATTIF
jgi:hypothetical protein